MREAQEHGMHAKIVLDEPGFKLAVAHTREKYLAQFEHSLTTAERETAHVRLTVLRDVVATLRKTFERGEMQKALDAKRGA